MKDLKEPWNKYKLLYIVLFIIMGFFIFLIVFSKNHITYLRNICDNDDFNYNLISFNSVIAGFLFSGISILISLLTSSNLSRLWKNGYLDRMCTSGIASILSSLFSICVAFSQIIISFNENSFTPIILFDVEVSCLLASLILFIICVVDLWFAIMRFKKEKKSE